MRIRSRSPDTEEQGFTLIELLVVVLIIGILAAIAIPVYLAQRSRAADAAAKSDLRQVAEFEETYLVNNSSYGTLIDLANDGNEIRISKGVTLTVVAYDVANGFCLSAKHAASVITWYYDSASGGIQPRGTAACPLSTAGPSGGSLTG